MRTISGQWLAVVCGTAVALVAGCSSENAPATANVAVSKAAVASAAGAGGMEFAPLEMTAARDELARANKAMADKDYKAANDLANKAQANANLAQGKANDAHAQVAAAALQDDVRVLRNELNRADQNAAAADTQHP